MIRTLYLFISLCLLFINSIHSQVGIGTSNPDASAALEITSSTNNKGVLLPRITQSQRIAISSPANGLIVYQTDSTSGLYYYNGVNWIRFGDVQTVNGVSPSLANGNIALTFLNTQTGTQSNRTSTSTPADGLVHIVIGNTPSTEDGKVYIYSTANSSWNETSAFTDDQDISGSSFDFATGDLVIEITGGASETISLASLTVTPTLDQVTNVGSSTTNSIEVGGLSTTENTIIGNAVTDDIVITARLNSDLVPKVDNNVNLGSASKRFASIYGTSIISGSSSLTLNTSATGTPTISFQQSGSEKAGIGSNTFFIGDSSAGTHYFFPQILATQPKNVLVTGLVPNSLAFLSMDSLEDQSLAEVLSNGNDANDLIGIKGLVVSQTASLAVGPDAQDIYIGQISADNDDLFINARLNTDLKLESDNNWAIGEFDKNLAILYSRNIISNDILSITTSNTTNGDIIFVYNNITKAGINSNTFFIGSGGGNRYEFPTQKPALASNQVLAYTATSSLTWRSLLDLPTGTQEGMSLRWNNTSSNWETASSTLIFSGGVSATTVTATNISIGSQITFSSNATSVPPLNLIANNLNDGVGALRMQGSEPDIYLNQNSAGFNTVTFATAGNPVNAFGKNSADDFYITVNDGGGWKNTTFNINNSTGDISMGYKLSVTGSSTLSELKVGASGSDYTLPTARGTVGQILTVSTTTNILTYQNPRANVYFATVTPTVNQTALIGGADLLNLSVTSSNGISSGGKYIDLPAGRIYKLTSYMEVDGDGAIINTQFYSVTPSGYIGFMGVSTSVSSTTRVGNTVTPATAIIDTTGNSGIQQISLKFRTPITLSGNIDLISAGSYIIVEEL